MYVIYLHKPNAPCILFIDEIDAVGRQRGSGLGGGHDEREQTLNQLLVEMDGFGINEGIITIAATNRPDILDPALLRPGRFDRRVIVGKPDLRGRVAILKVHARNKPLDKDINLETIAKKVPGFTGADLANLLNEAALLAARTNRKLITMQDLEEASEKVAYGPERRSHKVSEEERRLTAYHESGHAIMAILRKRVMEWGMSERLGPMIFGEHQEQIFLGKQLGSERNYGEDVASAIDEEMHKYLMDALNDTMRILNENIEVLHAMAKALLEEETINKQQVENLFKYHSIYAPGEEPMPILESDDN